MSVNVEVYQLDHQNTKTLKNSQRILDKLPPLYFSKRCISRYIVRSIQLCGDMSLAYDLLSLTAKEESA